MACRGTVDQRALTARAIPYRERRDMKAISIAEFGGPEVCRLVDADEPGPAAGEVTVRLAYAGVNFIDIYMRNGTYARSHTYQTPLPMTIGMEGAGTVTALGAGSDRTCHRRPRRFLPGARQLRAIRQCAGMEGGSDSSSRGLPRRRCSDAARVDRTLSQPFRFSAGPGAYLSDPCRRGRRRTIADPTREVARRPGDRHRRQRGQGGASPQMRRRPVPSCTGRPIFARR